MKLQRCTVVLTSNCVAKNFSNFSAEILLFIYELRIFLNGTIMTQSAL